MKVGLWSWHFLIYLLFWSQAFSHLFVVLESHLFVVLELFWSQEGMVDKDLLRNNDGKINNVTIVLNAYDVQRSELRLTHSISLSPFNNLWRKHRKDLLLCLYSKQGN